MKIFFGSFSFFLMLIVYIVGLFTQELSSKSIFFGVRVPVGYEKQESLVKLKKQFKKNYSLSFLLFTIVFLLLMSAAYYEVYIFFTVTAAFIGVIILNINYYIIHKKVKHLKKLEGWKLESSKVVVVDTTYRKKDSNNKKAVVSPWWFLFPAAIIVINLALILINYSSLPDKLPMHFNFSGEADSWQDKSYLSALTSVFIQSGITLLLYGVYKLTEKAKQSLNGGEVGQIKESSRRKRYFISIAMVFIAVLVNIDFFLISLSIMEVIKLNALTFNIIMVAMLIMPLILIIVEIINNKKESGEAVIENTEDGKFIINRDDDEYYWMGTWYYNKNDPALFVEKRVGFGMDFNYAKPAAKIIMAIVVLLIISVFVLVASIPGMTKGRAVKVTAESITISGTWGLTVEDNEISKIALENEMPKILMKTNGADIGNKLFGKHKLQGYSEGVLFVEDNTKPFVAIYTKDKRLILINYEDESKTDALYKIIKDNIR